MSRKHKEVYRPPRIKAVSFVVEIGLNVSSIRFEPDTWDNGMPGSHTSEFYRDNLADDGNTTTSFEIERW